MRGAAVCVTVLRDMTERYFSLEEANAQLPWLAATFARLDNLREELATGHTALLELLRQRSRNGAASNDQEIQAQQTIVEGLTGQIQAELQQITEKGIIVRDLERGLVDFPAYREGREVYLCWILGEFQIDFWHGTNEGFGSRKRV